MRKGLRLILVRWILIPAGVIVLILGGLILALWLATPPKPDEPPLAGDLEEHTFVHKNRERRYLLYRPSQPAERPGLVLVLPGSQLTPELTRTLFAYRFDQLAEKTGTYVLYPEGWKLEWNGCRDAPKDEAHTLPIDDVGFLTALIDHEAGRLAIDRRRIFAAGVSNGGQMVYRLATERPELFGAVAVLIAQQPEPGNSRCLHPKGPVSILIMNGVDDPLIPFKGGIASFYGLTPAGAVQPMDGTLAHWRALNGTGGPPARRVYNEGPDGDVSWVERLDWRSPGGWRVSAYIVHGGGHMVPGGWQYGPEFLFGRMNHDIHAADEIWRFFHP